MTHRRQSLSNKGVSLKTKQPWLPVDLSTGAMDGLVSQSIGMVGEYQTEPCTTKMTSGTSTVTAIVTVGNGTVQGLQIAHYAVIQVTPITLASCTQVYEEPAGF